MFRGIVLAIALCATTAHAQVGPKTGGPAPGDYNEREVAVDVGVTGSLARGLIDRDLVSGRGSFNFWNGPWGFFLQPYYLYGDVKLSDALPRTKTDDERYLRAILFRQLAKPLFGFGVGVADHSLRRRIDRRVLLSAGVGATLVNRPNLTFLTSLGLGGEFANYGSNKLPDMTIVPASSRHLARMSLRLYGRYKLAGGHLALIHDIYLLPNVQDTSDLRALASGVVEIPITAGFAARVQLDASYEQYIVPGTQHADIAVTFGASYRGDWKLATHTSPPDDTTGTAWQR